MLEGRDSGYAQLPLHIHMLGAGGAGMSGAARLLSHRGHIVTGQDREVSPFTRVLETEGVSLVIGASEAAQLPETAGLVARSAAVPDDDPQVVAATAMGLEVIKYAELLGRLAPAGRTLATAGTHGKTTTSWMLHGALSASGGPQPGALVGGIHAEHRTNAVPADPGGWFSVEACEYDRSFLHLAPTGAIVTNVEADHLDCYGSFDGLKKGFCRFADAVDPEGLVVLGPDVPDCVAEAVRGRVWRLGKELQVDLLAETRGIFRTRLRGPGWATPAFELSVPGRFNVENAALAIGLAVGAGGVTPASAARGVAEFTGVGRRFESWGKHGGVNLVHDYAHHPTEVRVTMETARRAFPNKEMHVLFQPHQASRTARLMDDFIECLRGLDRVVVADVYGARRHIDRRSGADSETLVTRLRLAGLDAHFGGAPAEAGELFAAGLTQDSVGFVLGAGDIDGIREGLTHAVAMRFASQR